MKYNNISSKNTRKGPVSSDLAYEDTMVKILQNHYAGCFLQDITTSFSIALSYHNINGVNGASFYKFTGDNTIFSELFGYQFLYYDFDELLSNILKNIIVFGHAFVERYYILDDNNKIVGINYECINCKKIKAKQKTILYTVKAEDKIYHGKISKDNILSFTLKELNYRRRFFLNRIRKLDKKDLTNSKIFTDKDFDFKRFKRKFDYLCLKETKGIYWYINDNQFLSEPHLLYRKINYDLLLAKFLDYFVNIFNNDLKKIQAIMNTSGTIECFPKTNKYDGLLEDLKNGNKNCDQVSKIVFGDL